MFAFAPEFKQEGRAVLRRRVTATKMTKLSALTSVSLESSFLARFYHLQCRVIPYYRSIATDFSGTTHEVKCFSKRVKLAESACLFPVMFLL